MNREDWLRAVAGYMEPWFEDLGFAIPRYRIAIGFTSFGRRGKRLGEAWDYSASGDGTYEILIRPDLEDQVEVAAVLAHEMIHVVVGIEHGHKGPFRRVAIAIGLTGKMSATEASLRFIQLIEDVLVVVGPIPHARLNFGQSTGPKKQIGRYMKAICPKCGYLVRVARSWVREKGAPHCPEHGAMGVAGGDDDASAAGLLGT